MKRNEIEIQIVKLNSIQDYLIRYQKDAMSLKINRKLKHCVAIDFALRYGINAIIGYIDDIFYVPRGFILNSISAKLFQIALLLKKKRNKTII
jgi:hypothetical protein